METQTLDREKLEQAKRLLLEKRLRGEAKPQAARTTIQRAPGGPAFPMSYQQEQLWFLDQLQPGSAFYNIPGANLISARVDVPTLERVFAEIVRRHAAIRTVYRSVDGHPRQIVVEPGPFHVPVEDLRGPNGEDTPVEVVYRRASEYGALPFDLEHGPLFRTKLYRISEADYLMVFNIHHIVTDGWSMPIVTREMEELYEAFSNGLPSPLPEPEIQYHDYAVWQRDHLSGDTLKKQVDYWKGHLQGAPAAVELPYDRPRPAVQSNRGGMYRFVYPGSLAERLRAVGKREGASLNMVFMAGFNLMLQRYSGQDDLVVGTLLGNRNRKELEGLVGYFVNSGAIRTRLNGDPTFRELVRQVRTAVLDADANQELPFDMVVDALKVQRDPSRNPLFQVMYFHHTFVGSHHLADEEGMASSLNLRSLYQENGVVLVDTGAAKFDMTVATLEMDNSMPSMVEYNTDIFDESTIARMIEHLRVLLESACDNPDVPVSRLEMVTEEERRTLLGWGVRDKDFPRDRSAVAAFEEQARATPDGVALVFPDGTLTYREMDERANRIAAHLWTRGVRPGAIVGVSTVSSAAIMCATVGVMKAGAAVMPLDPEYPRERLDFMVDDTACRFVLAEGDAFADLAHHAGLTVVRLDAEADAVAREAGDAASSTAGPEDIAYVIYTSGSTGQPKGVRVPHRGILRTSWRPEYATLEPGVRISQQASLSFDASTFELWGAWLNGATLVYLPRDVVLSPAEYVAKVREHGITTLWLTTGLFNQTVDHAPEVFSLVREVMTGGEAASTAHFGRVLREYPQVRLFNAYGPTETSVFATMHRATEADVARGGIPIGLPIAGASVYVLTPGGGLAGIGVPGELCVGGPGVAAGYLNRPEVDAQRFVDDPFTPGGRMYRTGDRVRWLAEGVLEFIGRDDDQVKVRGFRIELGEVESVLRHAPGVRDAAVAVRGSGDEKRLVGYVVPAEAEPTAADLRAFLKQHLPDYMIPTVFVTMEAMPIAFSGKVDRRRLPDADGRRLESGSGYAAPRTPAEEILCRLWQEVLGVERVGINDNFFTLGGDSILSIQIIARAGQEGLRVTPRHIFTHQTVAELAAIAGQAAAPVAEQGVVTGPVPLTPVQRWFFARDFADPEHFNLALLVEASEALDVDALRGACAAVIAHHDAFRMRYERGAEGWTQVNEGLSDEVPLEVVDLASVDASERDAARREAADRAQRSLDLEHGPLVRFVLFTGDGPQRLLLAAHHLVMDAVSWGFVGEDLETAYRQLASSQEVRLPKKTTSFRHWATRLAEYGASPEPNREALYWMEQQATPPLPVDQPGGGNLEGEAAHAAAELDEEATRALLQDVPPVYGTQINDVLLTALARAFRRWTGERALRIDLEGHGREDLFEDVDLSRTAGWFTAIYPVRLELPAADDAGEAIKAVKEQLRAIPGRGIGYGVLRYLSGSSEIVEALRRVPPPEVSFNYVGRLDAPGGGPDDVSLFTPVEGEMGVARSGAARRTHLLAVDAGILGGRLHVTFSYGSRLHRPETVEALARGFADELRALIEHCRDPQAGGFTPSDFELAGLDQDSLDALLAQIGD